MSNAERMMKLENWFQRCDVKGETFARAVREHLSVYKQSVDLMNQSE